MFTLETASTAAAHVANTLTVTNPVTGAPIGTIPITSTEHVNSAVARARAAQPAWAALGTQERARLLTAWAAAVWSEKSRAFQIIRDETGKTEASAYSEVAIMSNAVAYYNARAPRWLRDQPRRALLPIIYRATVHYQPYAVVGAITPWNYPYLNMLIDVIPALIAGCAVVIKPSEFTPLTALYAIEKMHAVGIPAGVIQVVTGAGDTGRAVIDAVDYVTFTGSTAVGRKVAVRCAERLIPCSLELGGKDAMIVLNDADIDQAALAALRGGLENAGQACVGIERIYVEAGAYAAFVERIRHHAEQLVCGVGAGFDVHMGSLTQERQLEKVEAHVAEALAKGAHLVTGGHRLTEQGALFYAPTVLTEVDHSMAVMTEETFGPILPIMKVRDADEAIRLANDSPYGLSAAIFSRDERRAHALAERLQTGDVSINGTLLIFTAMSMPMGGFKQSGLGRRGGKEGLMRYVQPQSIIHNQQVLKNTDLILPNPSTRLIVDLLRRMRRVLPGA